MELKQALNLAVELISFEIENPAINPPPLAWVDELRRARKALRTELARIRAPCGQFFISNGNSRKRKNSIIGESLNENA